MRDWKYWRHDSARFPFSIVFSSQYLWKAKGKCKVFVKYNPPKFTGNVQLSHRQSQPASVRSFPIPRIFHVKYLSYLALPVIPAPPEVTVCTRGARLFAPRQAHCQGLYSIHLLQCKWKLPFFHKQIIISDHVSAPVFSAVSTDILPSWFHF